MADPEDNSRSQQVDQSPARQSGGAFERGSQREQQGQQQQQQQQHGRQGGSADSRIMAIDRSPGRPFPPLADDDPPTPLPDEKKSVV